MMNKIMTEQSDCIRGFHHLSKAWYGSAAMVDGVVDEIVVGIYDKDGGTIGEFNIEWEEDCMVPKFVIWTDALPALAEFSDFMKLMAAHNGAFISAKKVCKILESCNIKDLTEVERPLK